MTKSVTYVRVSNEKHSLEPQIFAALSLARELGYEETENKIFKDLSNHNEEKISGLSAALSFIEENKVESFIVYDEDRISRNQAEFETIKKKIEDTGTKLVFSRIPD